VQGSVWESYCSLSICLNLFRVSACFAYGKTVINQRRVEKSAFEDQLEENSVWILKWTTLLGIFCKISLRLLLRVAIRYTPLKPIHTFLLRRCYATLGATGAKTSLKLTALNSPHPIHAADGHYTRNSSCITLLWLHTTITKSP